MWRTLPASAQIMRLGLFDLSLSGTLELGYESNVDGSYRSEQNPDYERSDFYWSPGLSLSSSTVGMRPNTTASFSGSYAYQDYFKRDDEDTALYSATMNLQTTLPRITLGAMGLISHEVESMQDSTYYPGGHKRDPMQTMEGTLTFSWNFGKLRAEANASYLRERHDKDEFKPGDQNETTLFAGVYLDLFTWGSLFYTWENVYTELVFLGTDTDETTQNFGLSGAIPVNIIRRPQVLYSLGFSYEEEKVDGQDQWEKTWEPTHTITVMDAFQLSKSLNLSMGASWEYTWTGSKVSATHGEDEKEVTFTYDVQLSHQLTPRAQHAVNFTKEPRKTFGSTTDTETTSYGYTFSIVDFLVYGLSSSFSLTHDLDKPLAPGSRTERTTTFDVSLGHSRQLSRKLSRNISYTYSRETTNFHPGEALEEHVAIYMLNYQF
ncbi:MAG: hypothetical protein GX803_02540 [Lentisphaerae bacterium]|jgi:hypothetical protein|nr:hypothetical protein [Lentisphaerota bacterium]